MVAFTETRTNGWYPFRSRVNNREAMPASTLTIRNLTSTRLELKSIESYTALPENGSGIIGNNVTGIVARAKGTFSSAPCSTETLKLPKAAHTAESLAACAQSYEKLQVSVDLEPFKATVVDYGSSRTKLPLPGTLIFDSNAILRLTVITCSTQREQHRVEIPLRDNKSIKNSHSDEEYDDVLRQKFTALVLNPRHNFTGIFISARTYLAIISTANLQCWMRELADATVLSTLSIPGTHNSPTHHKALPSVRCQAVQPREQLENGVRFLDVRVQPDSATDVENDQLFLVHSVFPISFTGSKYFSDLVTEIEDFLDSNPSETVIMSVKREGTGSATDEHLSKILRKHYTSRGNNRWYTLPEIPRLGEVRGKIVLLRRFLIDQSIKVEENGGNGWGLEAENWADNTPHDLHGIVCVQDFYKVLESTNIYRKINYVTDHLSCSAAAITPLPGGNAEDALPSPPLYLNFLSASNFWSVHCWPERIAMKLNPAIVEYICTSHSDAKEAGDGSTGILVCDFVGKDGNWDIVECIIGMNSRIELREKRTTEFLIDI